MQLCRESAANLLQKLHNCKLRLLCSLCGPVQGYSHSCAADGVAVGIVEGGAEDSLADGDGAAMVCSRNAHFINPSIFTFCSDSPSVMLKLRKDCLASNEFIFAYGYAPHAIHNELSRREADLEKKFYTW